MFLPDSETLERTSDGASDGASDDALFALWSLIFFELPLA
jgi:hypothetical protein